ncbi:MAG: helix-hairpin-helix domain-containing protein [Chloroflexi bacterium]|nr:helix-hairpin-helix domain-containing protein [Chloroflexota bacterium]
MSRSDRIVLGAGGCAGVLALCAAWLLIAPPPAPSDELSARGLLASAVATPASEPSPTGTGTIVVDVEGAVAAPGVRELPAGSRIADAIRAAGGYDSDADLVAAAATINLAQPLNDGEQVRVPRLGESVAAAPGAGPGAEPASGATGGLVDLNTATPEALEALPGIGPVTVQKIVAARQEQPFASLDDAVTRGVINRGQLEDIRDLATAG